ncbi:vacuolar protein sorting/targeting protein PEP1 [Paramecium bursaria]
MFLQLLFALVDAQVYFNTDSQIYKTYWCGIPKENSESVKEIYTLFAITEDGHVFRSISFGEKWSNESLLFEKMGIEDEFMEIYSSPANKEVIYLFARNGNGIRSEDCGFHYQQFSYPKEIVDFKLNSMDDEWILGLMKCHLCKAPYSKTIYVTNDGGDSWREILTNVSMAVWDKLIDSDFIADNRIVAAYLDDNKPAVAYSDDYFQTKRVIMFNGTGFFQTSFYMFIVTKQEDGFQLFVAPAFLDMAEVRPVALPFEEQYSYTILDTETDQIFLSVSHNSSNKKLTNIYTSDYTSLKFTISLLNNARSIDNGQCEFERILSLRGVYIANIYDHQKVQHQFPDKFKKTVITFDKGGVWHPIKAPEYDYQGYKLNCRGDCSLHLQGRGVSKIQSENDAVGVIIGTGNVGMYLDEKIMNTYFSRDGGLNWFEIREGHHIFLVGDRGGLIIMGRNDQSSDEIIYSWDEGLTWEILKLEVNITVQSIINKGLYQYYNIIGYDQENKGIIVYVNFNKLFPRVCTGIWDPTDPDGDYEMWMPHSFENGRCLMGQKYRFVRRKREAKCFNQQSQDKLYYIDRCNCTEEDWECDFGFYRKINGGKCVPIASMFEEDDYPDILKPPQNCSGNYTISQGYRKISGDYCDGGIDLGPLELPCPEQKDIDKFYESSNHSKQSDQQSNNQTNIQQNKININKIDQNTKIENDTPKGLPIANKFFIVVLLIFLIIIIYIIFRKKSANDKQPKTFLDFESQGLMKQTDWQFN